MRQVWSERGLLPSSRDRGLFYEVTWILMIWDNDNLSLTAWQSLCTICAGHMSHQVTWGPGWGLSLVRVSSGALLLVNTAICGPGMLCKDLRPHFLFRPRIRAPIGFSTYLSCSFFDPFSRFCQFLISDLLSAHSKPLHWSVCIMCYKCLTKCTAHDT